MAEESRRTGSGLETLARERFPNLTDAELRLTRSVPEGEIAFCAPIGEDDNPDAPQGWGRQRTVRAGLIKWLCVDQAASRIVGAGGLGLFGARITESLDLSFATIPFALRFQNCRFDQDCTFRSVKLPALDLSGSSIRSLRADGADITGSVFLRAWLLRDGFSAAGEVRLVDARISGQFDCSGATFKDQLVAEYADVKGIVFLSGGFSADSRADLIGARIGSLECTNGTFENLDLENARIEGSFDCQEASLKGLNLRDAKVAGTVFLQGSRLTGSLRLRGAEIGGDLSCRGADLKEVTLVGATIKGAFFWREMKPGSRLDLSSARVGALSDDAVSWPTPGNLLLDGFVYERFMDAPPTDEGKKYDQKYVSSEEYIQKYRTPSRATDRLSWIRRQREFKPQPYRQLARVLHEMGDEAGSRFVLFELVRQQKGSVLALAAEYPFSALFGIASLTALGWILHRRALRVGAIAPRDRDAYKEFHTTGQVSEYYPPFSPLIYSLENCLPVVKFGQDDRWQADPSPRPRGCAGSPASGRRWTWLKNLVLVRSPDWATSPEALRWFRWIMIGLGWLLTLFFVAGVSGLIDK